MFRAFQTRLNTPDAVGGTYGGSVVVEPPSSAWEWDIYQIAIQTKTFSPTCQVEVLHNNFFLCGSPSGSLDTATGPPDVVVRPSDFLAVVWTGGVHNDLATVGIWYNENQTGTTISLAH